MNPFCTTTSEQTKCPISCPVRVIGENCFMLPSSTLYFPVVILHFYFTPFVWSECLFNCNIYIAYGYCIVKLHWIINTLFTQVFQIFNDGRILARAVSVRFLTGSLPMYVKGIFQSSNIPIISDSSRTNSSGVF